MNPLVKLWRVVPLLLLAGLLWAATSKGPVTLAWDAVTLDTAEQPITVVAYNVRWGTTSGQHFSGTTAPAVTQYTIQGLDATQLYYFVVTAVAASGVESAPSTEVSARPALVPHQ